MAASSVSVHPGAHAPSRGKADKGLRLLRFFFVVLALGAAATLPFQLGALPLPSFLRPSSPVVSATNYPYTAVVGQTEKFSVQLAPGMANTPLTFMLVYPDKRVLRAQVRADAQGFASHVFRLDGYTPRHFREPAAIGVKSAAEKIDAFVLFAIQRRR